MRIKTVLMATDFSPESDGALKWAASLAEEADARLVILHVERLAVPYGGGEVYTADILDHRSDALVKMLEAMIPQKSRICCNQRLAYGDPATEIVRVAQEEHAEMIVMSTHARSGLPRLVLGSVAESVVRSASCPVLVFKAQVAQPRNVPALSA